MEKDKNVRPAECQHKECKVSSSYSCRFCEFSEAPDLSDGGCALLNKQDMASFIERRRQYLLDAVGDPERGSNKTQRLDYAKKRAEIMKMLERCGDYETLKLLKIKEAEALSQ